MTQPDTPDALRNPWVRKLLAATPRPGGLLVTQRAAGWAGVQRGWRILDPSCGKGATPVFFAQELDCEVTGFTADPQDLKAAREDVLRANVGHLVTLIQGDSLAQPPTPQVFNAAFLESSLSRSAQRDRVLGAAAWAVKAGGKVVVEDIAAEGTLPPEASAFIAAAGFGGALPSMGGYQALIESQGLEVKRTELSQDALALPLEGLAGKMQGAEFAVNLGLLPLTPAEFRQLRQMLETARQLVASGAVRFFVMISEKP